MDSGTQGAVAVEKRNGDRRYRNPEASHRTCAADESRKPTASCRKPLNRYFPELERVLAQQLPKGCVIDGEIVLVVANDLDLGALQQRLYPAASRVARLAQEIPAAFVAFVLLHPTRMTCDRAIALDWLPRLEGAGLDGVITKPDDAPYQHGKRAMLKIHAGSTDAAQ